ncbi:MAG: permease [Candidatus Eisenbacteria bacterium]|nr:permease [Candidatus Eisenbacteria bacterium]
MRSDTIRVFPAEEAIRPVPGGAPSGGVRSRPSFRRVAVVGTLGFSLLFWAADFVYRTVEDISFVNREECVLIRALPPIGDLLWEYFVETLILVLVGAFFAVLLGRWFLRFRRFYPRGPATAFLCGSVLPVCACSAIPLLSSMKGRWRFGTALSFVLAAPLLSPYILVLSFTVLGPVYGALRVAGAFLTVMGSTAFLSALVRRNRSFGAEWVRGSCDRSCAAAGGDVVEETWALFRRMIPYLLAAGVLGLALESLGPRRFLLLRSLSEGPWGVLAWIGVGIPLYFCGGSEVLFLRPLMEHGFPVGTAVAFSLTATAICSSSIAMLIQAIGARLTAALVISVLTIATALALVLNALF